MLEILNMDSMNLNANADENADLESILKAILDFAVEKDFAKIQ